MKFVLVPIIFFISCLPSWAALFPEDGSGKISSWYYSPAIESYNEFAATKSSFEKLGIRPVQLPIFYKWVQDISLLNQNGDYLNQADIPHDDKIAINLTMGVYGDPYENLPLTILNGEDADFKSRQMENTFVEGGELISGFFADGEGYAIIRDTVLERARRLISYKKNPLDWKDKSLVSKQEAINAIAKDFSIQTENIFVIKAPGHIDLYMKAMPQGVLLIQSTQEVKQLLKKLSMQLDLSLEERSTYRKLHTYYEEGFKQFDLNGKMYANTEMEFEDHSFQFDEMAKNLSHRFKIVRVAGLIKLQPSGRHINFLNSVSGISPKGQKFYFTNHAKELPALEYYWRQMLIANNYSDVFVEFPFLSTNGTGLDCASLLGP
jgi:hypothetical protein